MQLTTTITDEQFIARIRRWHRYRRIWGAAGLAIGLMFGGVVLFWGQHLSKESREVLKSLTNIEHPTAEQMQATADHINFYWGLTLGFIISNGLLAGLSLARIGFGCLVSTNRKNRMLLELWDRREDARLLPRRHA